MLICMADMENSMPNQRNLKFRIVSDSNVLVNPVVILCISLQPAIHIKNERVDVVMGYGRSGRRARSSGHGDE